jgi:hypothetical protein
VCSCVQAWGLLELQRGNLLGAALLLERCVRLDPGLQPVLRWAQVKASGQLAFMVPADSVFRQIWPTARVLWPMLLCTLLEAQPEGRLTSGACER